MRSWVARHVRTLAAGDADDLIQEAYARLWSSDTLGVANARAYLFAVVRNLVLEHARRSRIIPMERLGEMESLRIISEEPGPRDCHGHGNYGEYCSESPGSCACTHPGVCWAGGPDPDA